MEQENAKRTNTAQLFRDWMPLIALCVSGLVWGMKLETELAANNAQLLSLNARMARAEAILDRGILPRAEEKIDSLNERMTRIETALRQHEVKP